MIITDVQTQPITCDIVVLNGIIARWGSLKPYYTEGDFIRFASEEEKEIFKDKQRNGN